MEFGSKEWFDKLNEMVSFPTNLAFYVDKEGFIFAKNLGPKANDTDNIKYKTLKTYESKAIVSVKKCHTDEEYYFECKRLRGLWGR